MKNRFHMILLLSSVAAGICGVLAALCWSPIEAMPPSALGFSWARSRDSVERVDKLTNPMPTKGWVERGIVLADDRVVQLPGFRRLPGCSAALSEATRAGIEVGQDGRIYGLVRVWHWCGNDRVRRHIARVDLSRMLLFLDEGVHGPIPAAPCAYPCKPVGGRFSRFGWNVSEFSAFHEWNEALDSPPGKQAI